MKTLVAKGKFFPNTCGEFYGVVYERRSSDVEDNFRADEAERLRRERRMSDIRKRIAAAKAEREIERSYEADLNFFIAGFHHFSH